MSAIQPNPSIPDQKLASWNDKKSNCTMDIVKKAAIVGALYILGITLIAGAVASVVFAPALGAGLAIGMASFGFFGSFVTMGCSMGLMKIFDFNHYHNPKTVISVLGTIKNKQEPLPLDHFKRLHRYGILSDSELQQRIKLEPQAKQYPQKKSELRKKQREQAKLKREIEKFVNLPSFKVVKDKLETELQKIEKTIESLEEKIQAIKTTFSEFHKTIVDFNPNTKTP